MKIKFLLMAAIFAATTAIAQDIEVDYLLVYGSRDFQNFYKSKTYVVMDQYAESDYSKAIQTAVEKYWKITDFEVITLGQYREMKSDKTKSFLTREHVAGNEKLIYLTLFMGGQRSMETKGKILAAVPLKYYSEDEANYLYKLDGLVQYMQWQVNSIRDLKLTSNEDFLALYNKNRHVKKTKTLYIPRAYLTNKVTSLEQIKKYYTSDVKLVNPDQIKQAIADQDEQVIYLSIVGPAKELKGRTGFFAIYTAKDGEKLWHMTRSVSNAAPVGITGYDLKKMNK